MVPGKCTYCQYSINGHCNSGKHTTDKKGWYGLWEFWYNPRGIANLLSIPALEAGGYTIDYKTKRGTWLVTSPEGKIITFKTDVGGGLTHGMPFLDMRDKQAVALLNTVRGNFEGYTKRQIQKAIEARKLQAKLVYPTDEKLMEMVSGSGFKNCDTTDSHVKVCRAVFGPNRAAMRGKTVRQMPKRVNPEYVTIPRDFYELHKFVTLKADVMFEMVFLCW